MHWFRSTLLEHTSPGESVLVYAKKRLLEFGLQKDGDESGSPPYYCECRAPHLLVPLRARSGDEPVQGLHSVLPPQRPLPR